MALFGSKKKATAKKAAPAASTSTASVMRDLSPVLMHARITEKASDASARGVYVFDVARRATKRDVVQAVKAIYNVSARKVSIVTVPAKTKRSTRTGKVGVKSGGKKAYVYLKEGETITIA